MLFSGGVSTVNGPLRVEASVRGFVPLTPQPVSAEVLGGVRWAAKDWEFFALAGPGFGNAPGTPAFRAVLGVAFGGMKRPAPREVPVTSAVVPVPDVEVLPAPVLAVADGDGDGVNDVDDLCAEEQGTEPSGCVMEISAPPRQVELGGGKLQLKGSVYFDKPRHVAAALVRAAR